MKVTYSPLFKKHYDELPPIAQAQFQLIDAQVKAGNLKVLRKNAWVWYKGVGAGFMAWGTHFEEEDEFYWRDVDLPKMVPVIL